MNTYPHMCRSDHPEIGHSTDEEMCPVCIEKSAREKAEAALKDKVVEGERDWIEEARKYIEEQMDRDDGNDRQECGCFWRKFTSAWGNPGHDCDSIKLIHSLAALAAAQAQEKP